MTYVHISQELPAKRLLSLEMTRLPLRPVFEGQVRTTTLGFRLGWLRGTLRLGE